MQETKPMDRKNEGATQVHNDPSGKLVRWRLKRLLDNLYLGEMKILNPPERAKERKVQQ